MWGGGEGGGVGGWWLSKLKELYSNESVSKSFAQRWFGNGESNRICGITERQCVYRLCRLCAKQGTDEEYVKYHTLIAVPRCSKPLKALRQSSQAKAQRSIKTIEYPTSNTLKKNGPRHYR